MALLEYRLGTSGNFNPLPTPAEYYPSYTHLENSYVSAKGYFIRDIIRKNRAKVTCGWKALDTSQMSLLQSLYDKKSFYLRYTDNYGNRVTKKVYAGPLEGKAKFLDHRTYKIALTTDVSMNFIEY